nr:unnamed protein product [Callosobruchus chinensis]
MPLIFHMLDMCDHNAWPLHRMQGGALDHLSFRRKIAIAILEGNQRKFAKRSRSSKLENADSRYNRIDNNLIVTQENRRGADIIAIKRYSPNVKNAMSLSMLLASSPIM